MRLLKHLNEASGKTPFLDIVQVLQAKCKLYLGDMAKTGEAHKLYSGRHDNRDMFVKAVRTDRSPMDTPIDVQEVLDDLFYRKFRWRPRSNSLFVTSRLSTAESYGHHVYMIFPIGQYKYLWHNRIKDLWTEIEDSTAVNFYRGMEVEPDSYQVDDVASEFYNDALAEYERKHPEPKEEDFEDEDGEVDDAAHSDALSDWEDEKEEYARTTTERYTDEWIEDWKSNIESESYSYFSELVHGYKDKDLKGAIKWQGEIMLGCKEYVAVSRLYYEHYLSLFIQWWDWKKVPQHSDIIDFTQKNFKKFRQSDADIRRVLNLSDEVILK